VSRRGTLRIYLGAAPGVGKTFAMLNEGRRRRQRGTDVVVGFVETHGRANTGAQLGHLEVVPRRRIEYRGAVFEEMDLDAVLARRPEVALVDELAHTDVPGSRNAKRWQDVHELLDAGIDVVSTLNIQHLESLNDVVEGITGVTQRETIPDGVVRAAEQIELVDMTAEALRRRMAHGHIYAAEKVDAALANYFRAGNLSALRELALLWVADRVDESLEDYRRRHGIGDQWETKERVVVALTGAPGGEKLVRRAARLAQRTHGDLVGVHVQPDDGLSGLPSARLEGHRTLLVDLGGEFHHVTGTDVAADLVEFARAQNATQLVLGASRRTRWQELARGSVINRVIRNSGPIDVHVISTAADDERRSSLSSSLRRRRRRRLAALSRRRQAAGWLMGAAGLPLVTVALANLRDSLSLPSVLLIYLITVLAVAAVGGTIPALVAALSASLLANWFFTPPYHRFTVAEAENLLALAVFLVAADLVSVFVDLAARRRAEMLRARADAAAMARLAGSLAEEDLLPKLVDELRATFGAGAVAVLRRGDGNGGWVAEAASGAPVPRQPADASDAVAALGEDRVLVVSGADLAPDDRRLVTALAAQLAVALEARRLRGEAAKAQSLSEANDLRSALLQSVSHDLRTPLASIKAAITSLRQDDVGWSPEEVDELQRTILEETDRLTALVDNLLDMSRLQAAALHVGLRPTTLDEVVPAALASLGRRAGAVSLDVAEDLPAVLADPALFERVVANLIDNALTWSAPGQRVRVEAGAVAGRVDMRVVDRGPGIPLARRDDVFQPFQRLTDHGTGVGLGLAVARGFTRAMGGDLSLEDTPGGGTTAVVSLAQAAAPGGGPA
jgi:two-component system, OmpR family, sensor histidine kinase KdpD